jgi:cysteine synthase
MRRRACRSGIKHENHNPTCAFKVRGGLNLVGAMTLEERARGIVTASTGNHGQSIGLASRIHGVQCTGVRARGQQPGEERRDARLRRDGRRGRQGLRRGARALRRAARQTGRAIRALGR